MDRLDRTPDEWQDLEGDACSSCSRIGPQETTPMSHKRTDETLTGSDGRPYSIGDMFRDIREMKSKLDKACAFIDGEDGDGTDSAKVRLDRLEQAEKTRAMRTHVAFGASMTALGGVVVAWIKSAMHGGAH